MAITKHEVIACVASKLLFYVTEIFRQVSESFSDGNSPPCKKKDMCSSINKEDFELVVQGTDVIETASLEADAITQKQSTMNFDSLKLFFADDLNRVVNKMQSLNENFDVKINTLNQLALNIV